jgi:hypothetical protein
MGPMGPNGTVCRVSDPAQGGCKIDGSECDGEDVTFAPYNLTISKWDNSTKQYTQIGIIESHGLAGAKDTWQMYLHGPKMRPSEAAAGDFVPPFYVQATFTNMVYKFENVTKSNGLVSAKQKMVGNAVAPSTVYPVESSSGNKVQGLLVAEGNPFWANSPLHPGHMQIYKGGIAYLDHENCTDIFPTGGSFSPKVQKDGKVVNTIDCQKDLGVCFFSVWKFYDDQPGMWSNKSAPDCLYYCVLHEGGLNGSPVCDSVGVLNDNVGKPICHVDGLGAVHGFTVGNTLKTVDADNGAFDMFLMYTGGATFDKGTSMLRKITVSVSKSLTSAKKVEVTAAAPFGSELFKDTVPEGHDVGGDHAWVDATGKWLWVSTFRVDNPGVHMLDYKTGHLIYSIHGMDSFLKNNYAYSAGIHGIGSLGTPGSVLAVATSACTMPHSACFPMPWLPGVPSFLEGIGVMYILDFSKVLDAAANEFDWMKS